ncbi:hypothetical protein, partial [Burkholderia sp. SIMBA_019]|uniref:hypothetical protein n=1 Tax=Burkholderia sp. SIMBA_019 TaxID=3085765 RepID=UPI00397993E8
GNVVHTEPKDMYLARVAAINGGVAQHAPALTVNRLCDAVEKQWPQPLEIEEHSHADLANTYVAGASGLPFAVLRAYAGSDLPKVN